MRLGILWGAGDERQSGAVAPGAAPLGGPSRFATCASKSASDARSPGSAQRQRTTAGPSTEGEPGGGMQGVSGGEASVHAKPAGIAERRRREAVVATEGLRELGG